MSDSVKSEKAAYSKAMRGLFSASDDEVLAAVKYLSESGNHEAVFPLLEVLLNGSESSAEAVKSVFYQLKDRKAMEVLLGALDDEKYKPVWSVILASCWNSGMLPVDQLTRLCHIAVTCGFEEAFEVLTIVEAIDEELTSAELDPALEYVREFLMQNDSSHPVYAVIESLQVALNQLESQ